MDGDHSSRSGRSGEPDIDAIVTAVLGVEGVHDLHAGVLGEVATYLPLPTSKPHQRGR